MMAHGWRGAAERSIRSSAMRLRARGDGVSRRASSVERNFGAGCRG